MSDSEQRGVTTRPGNAKKHLGLVVTNQTQKRRSTAEVAAEKAAEKAHREAEEAKRKEKMDRVAAIKANLTSNIEVIELLPIHICRLTFPSVSR